MFTYEYFKDQRHIEEDEKIFFVKKIVVKKPQYYTANNLQ